jgi:hypothetical protein
LGAGSPQYQLQQHAGEAAGAAGSGPTRAYKASYNRPQVLQ